MTSCPSCGQENPDGFRFCGACGGRLPIDASAGVRKTVTIVFCDVADSTAIGESVDPEALRVVLARYFERVKGIVELHGGTVEKFIGDAVMAVFGVPYAHEDDALRAVRAAAEMQAAMPELGVQARIGVDTGEVVSGTGERLAVGDAVNVAARLEQAARPGEVLIGEQTLAFVENGADVEPVEPLRLKGKTERVHAFRLLGVHDVPPPAHELPFVGREPELALLRDAWRRVSRDQECELVTIVGDAGIGKSRLVAQLLRQLHATVVQGRCLPYGNGITYWPVVEIARQLRIAPDDPRAAVVIRSLLGESDAPIDSDEIAWAFRKLLEKSAPLVVVFDDIHHGEETLLELIEHVALTSSASPILMICMARTELAERHPVWPVTLRLEPLSDEQVDVLTRPAEAAVRAQILRVAGGNPLFVSEMLALSDAVHVPPTLQALLVARLDQLEPQERRVLESGAVEGEVFHRGAVHALVPDQTHLTHQLASLVRKGLIRATAPSVADEDAFRFRHLLIRDAAYEAIPKAVRADLHERFARWAGDRGRSLAELDEILGYHLEQAVRYAHDLGRDDPALAERAGARLAAGGRRALWRGDERAAARLLERALVLTRPLRVDVHLELDLAEALGRADPRHGKAIAVAAADQARTAGDAAGEALAETIAAQWGTWIGEEAFDECEAKALATLPQLEEMHDHAGLVHLWTALADIFNSHGQWERQTEACERALRHARLAGQQRPAPLGLAVGLYLGPRPADEALERVDELLAEQPLPGLVLIRARLLAMLGRFDEAVPLARDAAASWRDLAGIELGEITLADVAVFAGDHEGAAGHWRAACESFEQVGNLTFFSTYGSLLARQLCAIGRHDEAEVLADRCRRLGASDDLTTQIYWRQAKALVLAHRGECEAAEALVREAIAIAERTDSLLDRAIALWDLAEVLYAEGRSEEAAAVLEEAIDCEERKKNLALATQMRARLSSLTAARGACVSP